MVPTSTQRQAETESWKKHALADPGHTDLRADTTDSEDSRSVRARTRSGQEGTSPRTPENGAGMGGGSPHPLLEAIDRMEVGQEARIS
ncbi:hypothetical protein NDU88_006702 [Pleurodeles waltl]|uniref:Uncharacterized protein n=1 Tax=Pleurodeles waltl TaxID=8319 RepID=A0AAV7UMP3_PLEWA|nr:hypothetical protein NDU88_006702 [Pleurodeles waltl]